VTSCVLLITAAVVVLIRIIHTKFFTRADLDLSDLTIVLVLLLCIPSLVANFEMTMNGLGRDIWELSPDEITRLAMFFFIATVIYFIEVAVLKLSILFFYLRIFPGKTVRRLLWTTIVFVIAFGIAFFFAAIFQCIPISYNWTNWRGQGGGHCVNISVIAWANAGVSIALDL
jgi:hypothetical protein